MGNESASGAARLPRTSRTCPGCGAPDGLFPDPRFIDVVHTERNFTRSSAGLFLPRYPPSCLYLQREPGVRWPRSSPAASETSCAVSACAQGREADRARCLGARGAKPPSQLHTPQQRSRDKRDRGSPTARAVADRGPRSVSLPSSALRRRREARGERRERAPAGHVPEGRLCLQPEAVQLPQSRYQLCISTRNR